MNHKNDESTAACKNELGKLISECRGVMSQRKLAAIIGLPPSNMKYIEDGVNAPSPEIYSKIIAALNPTAEKRKAMDRLYTAIRKIPPPDICDIFIQNEEMVEIARIICQKKLSDENIQRIRELFNELMTNNEGDLT